MSDYLTFNLVLLVNATVWHLVKSASHNVLNIEKKFRNQPGPGGITKFCHKINDLEEKKNIQHCNTSRNFLPISHIQVHANDVLFRKAHENFFDTIKKGKKR